MLVVDSMTGQDAVNVADTFNKELGIDGMVLTKLDGDTRGGAALSVKKVTGSPIKFAATGEKSNTQEENIFRRMEILFFGSLTIITFSGWLAFSLFNIIIYSDDFGILRPSQNLALYLGSGILSLSVSLTDLINNLQKKRKFRYVEFY